MDNQDKNYDLKRYYGLRIGDIVSPKEVDRQEQTDLDILATKLNNQFGSSHLVDGGDENNPYDYWLMDVTVKNIIDFIKNMI